MISFTLVDDCSVVALRKIAALKAGNRWQRREAMTQWLAAQSTRKERKPLLGSGETLHGRGIERAASGGIADPHRVAGAKDDRRPWGEINGTIYFVCGCGAR
jgi:hypothetical protein